ncbi:MAG: MFS transporter [Chloroflexi bacterium]|nr:MFS transporter [Chloroflexota bacterium]
MLASVSRKMDAYHLYLVMTGTSSIFITFVFAVNMVYQVETVDLSPLQLVLVGTALEVAVFLFEVPTGIVADMYSRRLSIIIGYGLMGCGFLLEGAVPSFEAILLAQVVWGVGYTFTSGAHQAWITDEIGEDRVGRVFMRAAQVGSLIGIPATLVAIAVGSVQVNLPILLGGALHIVLALVLALVMPETGFQPAPRESRSAAGQMLVTLRAGVRLVRLRPVLLAILGIGFFYGLYTEGLDRLWTAHLLESFSLPDFGGLQPVAWMGLLSMVGGLLAAGATQIVLKRLDMKNTLVLARAAFGMAGLLVLAVFGFAVAGSFAVAVLLRWAISILRTLIEPLQTTWINQHLDSSVRATIISMSGQVDAIGQIAGGTPVGWVGNALGLRAALAASAALLLPVLPLYARVLRRQPAEAEAPAGD